MKTLKFSCELLTDIILNQKSASEGQNTTLDFIPGSCFLGIVASQLYPEPHDAKVLLELFHSGKVRFGDAHPAHGNVRTLKVPTALFYPKLGSPAEQCYIIYETNSADPDIKKLQLKQCRSGFYDFSVQPALKAKTQTTYSLKSAYDRKERRSKDAKMFGYEALQKGLTMFFSVEVDNDELDKVIIEKLIGRHRVGRSRTAQYGLVEIKEHNYDDFSQQANYGNEVVVYADSRLIFLDEYGLPTFRPTAQQLGFDDNAEIDWNKTQIRTFQYAPYNYKRQCFDTDRCGIEKGSVFVVKNASTVPDNHYVGVYNNEGFGKVMYNPSFLNAGQNGIAKCTLSEDKAEKDAHNELLQSSTPLAKYLKIRQQCEENENEIYKLVEQFVNDKDKGKLFIGKERFASQWGTIRSIAMQQEFKQRTLLDEVRDYVSHGKNKDNWDGSRYQALENFMNNFKKDEKQLRRALINLASEMAKLCSKED